MLRFELVPVLTLLEELPRNVEEPLDELLLRKLELLELLLEPLFGR